MAEKCVVEGCNLEYDVICSFSFYNVNVGADGEALRQEWIEGAMQEESECLWRHVNLQLCGYHFELDSQGLWIDSPMLPDLLTLHDQAQPQHIQTPNDKRGAPRADTFQKYYEKFITKEPGAAEIIRSEHNYCAEAQPEEPVAVSRLNVRQLVDTLGYLSLKNLQRKQLWVVKVESDKAEASISQSEQVITKMQDPKQIIEIIPQTSSVVAEPDVTQNEVLQIMDESGITDNFIYEIAEEQEITMDEVKEISVNEQEWTVNIIPDDKPKYAYIKHCNTGKKKRHFTAEMNEITLHGDFENYYILPDADPSVGVEITTSYEPENYIVQEYEHLVLEDRPRKRREPKDFDGKKKKKRLTATMQTPVKQIQIKTENSEDWVIDNSVVYEQDDDYDDKKGNNSRVRRKNKKYLGFDFVT